MAASCWRAAWRPFCYLAAGSGIRGHLAVRHGSFVAQKVKAVAPPSPWVLHGAVCLQRLPVVSQERNPMEERFLELLRQMELERSFLSDHEVRLLEDAERMSRKQEADYDSDEEEGYGGKEIVMGQDLEDAWEQKLKRFLPASRTSASDATDVRSAGRCLGDSLVLLVRRDVGSQKLWLLPQLPWDTGETLRETAERALASLPGNQLKATFLGNAPCGFYKYKFPKSVRTESQVGAKVFFFKAVLSGGGSMAPSDDSVLWVKKDELQNYLPAEYLQQVQRFIIDL